MPTPTARLLSSRGLVVAGVATALVAGLLVGVWIGRERTPAADGDRLRVAVGAVGQARGSAVTGWDFALPVFNGSGRTVHVALAGLTGLVSPLDVEPDVEVPPGAWGNVRFAVPTTCDTPVPAAIPSARVRLTSGGATARSTVPVQAAGSLVVDYLRAVCGIGGLIGRRDLVGTWAVEQAFGPERYVAGALLMRFTREGEFTTELEDGVVGAQDAVRGRYQLRGDVLVITTENGAGCGAGARATWRTTLGGNGRLRMVYLDGDCPEGVRGNVWVSRRVLRDDESRSLAP